MRLLIEKLLLLKNVINYNFIFLYFTMTNKTNYSPIYFLAALWPGWMAVSFFMYLMFIIPRDKKFVIPTFNTLQDQFVLWNIWFNIVIVIALIAIIFFAWLHFKRLFWNLKNYLKFRKTSEYSEMKNSKAEIQFAAVPLTFAMTINVWFILWAVFVPWLWNYVEYLFPLALIWFSIVWIYALKIFFEYFTKLILKKWNTDFIETNNLSHMLSIFSFVMVWVWFAASAAMSQTKITVFFWLMWSIWFITLALFVMAIKLILWFSAIFRHWIEKAGSPSLWIIIPFLTLLWITIIRDTHWLHMFWWHFWNDFYLVLTTVIFTLQLFFGYLGFKIMKDNNYFKDYIYWNEKNPWTYALICPWVAFVVFWFFFLHIWLVKSWIVTKFGISYFMLLVPFVLVQLKTILVMFKLNKKFF